MTSSIARETLEAASFFVDEVKRAGAADRQRLKYCLNAAIVFARSVTLHIQKQYSDKPDFASWYATHQQTMGKDPLCKFFLEKRNFVLKEGQIEAFRIKEVKVRDAFVVFDSVTPAGQPGEQQGTKREPEAARNADQPARVETKDGFYFPEFRDRLAVDLLRDYLDKLEVVVNEAEQLFGEGR